ncbi:MAG: DUF2442 domain-containing protein [Chloroflexi bacterium]|nr:DUF2442 domain-containing protein [Chloroflexota bacterium]
MGRAKTVSIAEDTLKIELCDGRIISAPLNWYPRLLHGTPEERANWRLIGQGEGIHWPDLDEDISAENLIYGQPSGESQKSFQKWQESRPRAPSPVPRAPSENRDYPAGTRNPTKKSK